MLGGVFHLSAVGVKYVIRPGDEVVQHFGLSGRARSCSAGQNLKIMHYVYILKSKINNDLYIGSTNELKSRYQLHNSGRVKSTKAYKPWVLVYYEAYRNKKDTTKRERELKIHAVKKELIKRLKNSLEI